MDIHINHGLEYVQKNGKGKLSNALDQKGLENIIYGKNSIKTEQNHWCLYCKQAAMRHYCANGLCVNVSGSLISQSFISKKKADKKEIKVTKEECEKERKKSV